MAAKTIHKQGDERSADVLGFIEDLLVICKGWGVVLSHEDMHGAFIVRRLPDGALVDDDMISHLREAFEAVQEEVKPEDGAAFVQRVAGELDPIGGGK